MSTFEGVYDQDPRHTRHGRNNRKGILKSCTGQKYGDHEVDHLHETLDDANCTMSKNERLLSNYRTTNIRQSMELDELRSQLERSRDQLNSRSSSPQQVVHFHTAPSPEVHSSEKSGEQVQYRLLSELEQEKLSRQRAEIERSKLMSLLDASFKKNHCTGLDSDKVTNELSYHLRELQDELKESQLRSSRHEADIDTRLKEIEDKLHKTSTNKRINQKLAQELEKLKNDRDSERNRTELIKELKSLESELLAERKLLDCSQQQTNQLASKVDELGFQLDEMQHEKHKALSCLEQTNHHLGKTLSDQHELEKEVRDLKHQLSTSEKEKVGWQEECAMLVKEYRLQMERDEHARDKMMEIQEKLANSKTEKLTVEEKYMKVMQQLHEKVAEVSQLKEQCNELQLRLAESNSERERGEDIKRKFADVEQASNERKTKNCQLKAELKNAANRNRLLQDQIQMLEDNLCKSEEAAKHLERKLMEASSRLQYKEGETETSTKELELWKTQVCCLTSEKEQLELENLDLKNQLISTKKTALRSAKKHKLRYKQVEKESLKLEQEKEQLQLQSSKLLKDHEECITKLRNLESLLSVVQQENEEFKGTVRELENLKDHQDKEIELFHKKLSELRCNLVNRRAEVEKCGVKLKDSENERGALLKENMQLKQDLNQSKDEHNQTEREMALQLCQCKEVNSSQLQDLKRELQSCKEETVKVREKLAKVSHSYQSLKAELVQVKSEYEHKQKQMKELEECLEATYLKTSKREQNLSSEFNSLKVTHSQELGSLQEHHKQTTSKLQQRISELQIQLADEQSTVRAMRRHQLQLFGDQHKMLQHDLTKSLDDTEILRRKYVEAKQSFEEKEASLEEKVSEKLRERKESLHQQLAKSQLILHQQIEDYEVILRAAAGEVDELVKKIGKRVHIPVFPTIIEKESSAKNWTAEIMAKFQWLQKEVSDVVAMEIRQRRKLKEQQL